jgi:hypothetical protein
VKQLQPQYAKLEKGKIIKCGPVEWATWDPEHVLRQVGRYETETHLVSTVFLGRNHAMPWDARPLWFDTTIFDKTQSILHLADLFLREEIYCERYATLAEAKRGHEAAIAWLNESLKRKK